jgi:hypothetical protein
MMSGLVTGVEAYATYTPSLATVAIKINNICDAWTSHSCAMTLLRLPHSLESVIGGDSQRSGGARAVVGHEQNCAGAAGECGCDRAAASDCGCSGAAAGDCGCGGSAANN